MSRRSGRPQSFLALQATAGNAAVVQLLRTAGDPRAQAQDEHQHGAGCGHQSVVQRSAVHDVLRGGGRPLDDATRTDMEARLGSDFSGVRIHDDSAARASAAELGARAYTSGDHVVIGDGGADKHTLAHELTHVVQQRQGPVAGTANGSGLKVSDPSDRFEREAEANATRVMSGAVQRAVPAVDTARQTGGTPSPVVQRVTEEAADVSVDQAVAAAVTAFLGEGKAPRKIFKRDDSAIAQAVEGHYLPAHGDKAEFERRVRRAAAPAPPDPMAAYKKGLNEDDQADLMREMGSIQAQLNAWKNVKKTDDRWPAGCNQDGTWGTSAGGAGADYRESSVSRRVGANLQNWWTEKKGGYIASSRTTGVSLKKDLAGDGSGARSPKFIYHIKFVS
ncbi:eCIS core domain-containing protein [Streptomyces sp. NBC_00247]|uniref:eCIS core domain-containing protein n=1 Tax=Streptomyces sp. NBC_00247 TaxID=2975689 RepID=UPI003FA7B598